MTTHLLYLHGFRSSPRSFKAQRMAAAVQARGVHWLCPQLPPSPAQATAGLLDATRHWPRGQMAVVGSSLGGFYARWFALQTGCPAVLLNPAAQPARDLARHVGEQTAWHDPAERFWFDPAYVDELRALEADITRLAPQHPATPQNQLAIVAQGDEVLDWREMQAFCAGGRMRLLAGSDHALSDFDDHLAEVLDFLDLQPA